MKIVGYTQPQIVAAQKTGNKPQGGNKPNGNKPQGGNKPADGKK